MRVHDQNSRNGTFRAGVRDTAFDIVPGDKFEVATIPLLALDDGMQVARPVLSHVLGYDRDALVDDVLAAAIQGEPLLVVGPNGAGQWHLVKAIHQASRRRKRPLIEVPGLPPTRDEQKNLLLASRRSTLAVGSTGAPLDQAFLDMALSPEFWVRLVVLAPSPAAEGSVPPTIDGLMHTQRIGIRPLRERQHEIVRLIDHVLFEGRERLRFSDLTADNQRALRAYDWPGNLDELGEVVGRIVQIVRAGSLRKAAQVLDTPRTSLYYALERLGLRLPLTRSGFSIEGESSRKRTSPVRHDKGR